MNLKNENEVFEILEKLRQACFNDLNAEQASKILLKISSLYGTVVEIAVDAEMTYNRRYRDLTDEFEKVSEARAKAKASEEYERMLRLEGRLDVIRELIRSLKYLLKVKLDEGKEAVY